MAKKNRRKNPMVLRKRRRNPDVQAAVREVAGDKGKNILNAVVAAVAGGASLAVGSKLLGERVGQGSVGQGVLAVASGVGGGAIALMVADMLGPGTLGDFLKQAAVPAATGAMALGFWKIAQGPVEGWLGERGLAGLSSWTSKDYNVIPAGLGSYSDEWTLDINGQPIPKVAGSGLGGSDNPFATAMGLPSNVPGMGAYEPLGDIYNNQRLGSFEAEGGFGEFTVESFNPMNQQEADDARAKALTAAAAVSGAPAAPAAPAAPGLGWALKGYEGYGAATGFEADPFQSTFNVS